MKEITSENITSPTHDILTDIFKIEDSLDSDTFWHGITSKYFSLFRDSKTFDNSTGLCQFNLLDHLFNQIGENANKENLKTSIKLQKAYNLNDNKYDVKFIVERESNTKNNSNTIKTQEYYDAKVIFYLASSIGAWLFFCVIK
ncbi:hypothetical protein [Inconstantimicrobium mannanitabidum]|uniref:Uncharacterized protein n=1 Tax=Inconstantimicrobium mannanitabidum TaxID=1604901 RepID=A0ACB5RGF2_9CLOT|nr:hypothetical protein [Clostridium sp. TW13]GKX68174.1 hypothetical protein rsdtw13_34320 [Clostridium sp. TW13]